MKTGRYNVGAGLLVMAGFMLYGLFPPTGVLALRHWSDGRATA